MLIADTAEECEAVHHDCLQGLGDWIAYWLKCTGITQARYLAAINWARRRLGKPQVEGCNCAKRREALNKLGNAIYDWLK